MRIYPSTFIGAVAIGVPLVLSYYFSEQADALLDRVSMADLDLEAFFAYSFRARASVRIALIAWLAVIGWAIYTRGTERVQLLILASVAPFVALFGVGISVVVA
jgi:hypothetical protein